jgi:hypothetical protein
MADLGLIRQDRRNGTVRRIALGLAMAVLAIAFLLSVPLSCVRLEQWRLDRVPLNPANFGAAGPDLVRLCQTDPAALKGKFDGFDTSAAPPSIRGLHPESIDIAPDQAVVYWGGGFYHCGWRLLRQPDAGVSARSHGWTLSFFTERERAERVLQTFTMPVDACFTAAELTAATTRPAAR